MLIGVGASARSAWAFAL